MTIDMLIPPQSFNPCPKNPTTHTVQQMVLRFLSFLFVLSVLMGFMAVTAQASRMFPAPEREPLPAIMTEAESAPDLTLETEEVEPEDPIKIEMLDWSRSVLADYIEELNDGLDSFFVESIFDDDAIDDKSSGSNGRVFFKTRRVRGEGVDYQSGINLKLALPQTNNQLKLLIETDEDDDEIKESDALGTVDNVTYSTALRVLIQQSEHWNTNLDNGIRWEGEPVPFTRIRARRTDYYDTWRSRFNQTVFWRSNIGWGENTRYSAIRPIDIRRSYRFALGASYLLNDDFFELNNSYGIFDELDDLQVLYYSFTIKGDTDGIEKINRYTTAISYRRKVYRNFVLAELVPEVSWPRDRNFEPTPALTFKLDIIFGPD